MQNNIEKEFFYKSISKFTSDIEVAADKLINFCEYIKKANKLHNLTSITKTKDMLTKHILDSLSIKHLLEGNKILDIGSGAGFPGIPLAILSPESHFLLLDSNNKKIIFLNHVKINLNIRNVDLVHERIENFDDKRSFDSIVCRSFSTLSTIFKNSENHLKKEGIIIAMKGKYPDKELLELDKNVNYKVEKLIVPGLSAERHAVIMSKNRNED